MRNQACKTSRDFFSRPSRPWMWPLCCLWAKSNDTHWWRKSRLVGIQSDTDDTTTDFTNEKVCFVVYMSVNSKSIDLKIKRCRSPMYFICSASSDLLTAESWSNEIFSCKSLHLVVWYSVNSFFKPQISSVCFRNNSYIRWYLTLQLLRILQFVYLTLLKVPGYHSVIVDINKSKCEYEAPTLRCIVLKKYSGIVRYC